MALIIIIIMIRRFYSVCIFTVCDILLCCRDLKPENILLDDDGEFIRAAIAFVALVF